MTTDEIGRLHTQWVSAVRSGDFPSAHLVLEEVSALLQGDQSAKAMELLGTLRRITARLEADSPGTVSLRRAHSAAESTLVTLSRPAQRRSSVAIAWTCTRDPYPGRPLYLRDALWNVLILELQAPGGARSATRKRPMSQC